MTGATFLYLLLPPAAALLLTWAAARQVKRDTARIDAMLAERAKRASTEA
jgi:hypothetical protein